MANISIIAPISDFHKAVNDGFITLRPHREDANLVVANYTPTQQFRNIWDPVTLASRGLIFRLDTGEIVAYPFGKFFNHGDPKTEGIDTSGVIEVMDKADGSCGILYKAPDGRYAVSTRGSMHSEQAEHATKVFRDRYEGNWTPDEDHTFVFEIIYPEGRIVLDYNGMDDLILLGAVNKSTGVSLNRNELESFGWTGPIVEAFNFANYADVFKAPQVSGREGFVVRFVDSDARIKVKFEEYLVIHRLLFNLSERRVWEMLSTGADIDNWLMQIPDEFTKEVKRWRANIAFEFASVKAEAFTVFEDLQGLKDNRREFAQTLMGKGLRKNVVNVVFALLDGKSEENINSVIWTSIRP